MQTENESVIPAMDPVVASDRVVRALAVDEKIRAKNKEIDRTEVSIDDLKELLKQQEAERDALCEQHRAIIRGDDATLWDAPLAQGGKPAEEPWRKVTLSEIGISGRVAEKLTEAGLTTLGLIADYTTAGKKLTDIKGIGVSKGEEIEAAMERYWQRNPRPKPAPKEDAKPDAPKPEDGPAGEIVILSVDAAGIDPRQLTELRYLNLLGQMQTGKSPEVIPTPVATRKDQTFVNTGYSLDPKHDSAFVLRSVYPKAEYLKRWGDVDTAGDSYMGGGVIIKGEPWLFGPQAETIYVRSK